MNCMFYPLVVDTDQKNINKLKIRLCNKPNVISNITEMYFFFFNVYNKNTLITGQNKQYELINFSGNFSVESYVWPPSLFRQLTEI